MAATSAREVALSLGDWTDRPGALYRQLAGAINDAATRGDLQPETVLPPERVLARALNVSRSTVVSAYELLKEEGLLEARQGSGTWLRGRREVEAGPLAATALLPDLDHAQSVPPAGDIIEFTISAIADNGAVAEAMSRVAADRGGELALALSGHGYVPGGLASLRASVAGKYEEAGVETSPDQVLITSGAQQAIALLTRHYVRPGDTVLVESPTYPGAIDVLRAAGARLHAVPVGPEGARIDVLEDLFERVNPRMVFLSATYNNPTGSVMSAESRARLAALAAKYRVPVIDDRSMAHVPLTDEEPPPPLAAFGSPTGPILTVGSTSKTFWAGLRVGWVRGPEDLIHRLVRHKTVDDLGTSLIAQMITTDLLERRDAIMAERREVLQPRLQIMERELARELPSWSWVTPKGGLALWIRLPLPSSEEFLATAARHRVSFVPGPALSADEGNRDHLRLHFVHDEATMIEGVRRLAAAWDEHVSGGRARRRSSQLVV